MGYVHNASRSDLASRCARVLQIRVRRGPMGRRRPMHQRNSLGRRPLRHLLQLQRHGQAADGVLRGRRRMSPRLRRKVS